MRLFLLSAFICGTSLAYSASNLGWGTTTFSKDTLFLGDTLFITSFLKNYDPQAFNDSVQFSLKINGILNVNPLIFPNPFPNQPLNIAGNDSLPANLSIIITQAWFLVGPDILVVWPRANDGSRAHDSIIKTIVVLDPRSVGLKDETGERLRVFYRDEMILLEPENPEIIFNRVRIFNLSGQEIKNEAFNGGFPIPFDSPPKGVYYVEVTFNLNEKRILKIAKR
ncbi:MAG: T9SS type A sorting domain-containing protein [Bacteroidota bacterium]